MYQHVQDISQGNYIFLYSYRKWGKYRGDEINLNVDIKYKPNANGQVKYRVILTGLPVYPFLHYSQQFRVSSERL